MLAIRLRRVGRKGQAHYRILVQDSRHSPKSGKVVAYLGSLDPHNKTTTLKKEEVTRFLNNGAQPSNRVAQLLKAEGVKLPKWVVIDKTKQGKLRNPEKLRKNRPAEEATKAPKQEPEEQPKPEAETEKPASPEKPAAKDTDTKKAEPAKTDESKDDTATDSKKQKDSKADKSATK